MGDARVDERWRRRRRPASTAFLSASCTAASGLCTAARVAWRAAARRRAAAAAAYNRCHERRGSKRGGADRVGPAGIDAGSAASVHPLGAAGAHGPRSHARSSHASIPPGERRHLPCGLRAFQPSTSRLFVRSSSRRRSSSTSCSSTAATAARLASHLPRARPAQAAAHASRTASRAADGLRHDQLLGRQRTERAGLDLSVRHARLPDGSETGCAAVQCRGRRRGWL